MTSHGALLDVLDTRVRVELARRASPVNVAPDELVDDRDDRVDGTNELVGRVSFTGSSACHRPTRFSHSLPKRHGTLGKGCRVSDMLCLLHDETARWFYVQAKSTVQPYGVPSSSLRAYFFPIEALESSTRLATPSRRIFRAIIGSAKIRSCSG